MEQQQGLFSFDYGPQGQGGQAVGAGVVNNWYQKESADLPWDLKEFFGVDGFVGPGLGGVGGDYGHMHMTLVSDERSELKQRSSSTFFSH